MALQLTISGVDYTSALNFESVKIQQSREAKGSTLNFELKLYDSSLPTPKAGNEVIFIDGSTREFAGTLVTLMRSIGESNRLVPYPCQCIDYTYLLDRRKLNKIYSSAAADDMVKEILDDLKSAANDADTHYNDFQSNKTEIDAAPTIRQQRFEYVLPSQAFDTIAEASGMMWWIDFSKVLHFTQLESLAAPLPTPVDFDGNATLLIDTDVENYFDFEEEESILGAATKPILRDLVVQSASTIRDEFIWTNADSNKFILSKRPFSDLSVSSVTHEGNPLDIRLEGITLQPTDAVTTGECALYVGPRPSGVSYVRLLPGDWVDAADIVLVTYQYEDHDDFEDIDTSDALEELADRTGGDGIHEFVFSQTSELAVSDRDTLDDITTIILDRKAKIHYSGSFSSLTKGWAAGQVFVRNWQKEGLSGLMHIVNVRKTILTPADDPNTSSNVIETQIQYSNMPRGMRI